MRPRIRKTLVALAAAFGMTVAFAGAASAAKPAPAPTCPSGDTTVVITFDRAGNPVNNDPTVTVTGDSTAGTVATDGSVLITGYARVVNRKVNDFVTLADPATETSYDNAGFVNKRGKALDLSELDVCTTAVTVTPPPTVAAGITFGPDPDPNLAGYTLVTYAMPSSPDREVTYYLSGYNEPADNFVDNQYVASIGTGVSYYYMHAAPGNHITGSLAVDTTTNVVASFDCVAGSTCPMS